jgi:hypothetical protein
VSVGPGATQRPEPLGKAPGSQVVRDAGWPLIMGFAGQPFHAYIHDGSVRALDPDVASRTAGPGQRVRDTFGEIVALP